MTAFMRWLEELDEALVDVEPSADPEHRLEALVEHGVHLLGDGAPDDLVAIDANVVDRVQRRLRAIADEVALELDAVRRARHELARAGRAHAGYRATAAP